jgi:hypothetical protein
MPNPTFRHVDDKRVGAVLVFNKGVTTDEVKALCRLIDKWGAEAIDEVMTRFAEPQNLNNVDTYVVREFNPNHGTPVWYIP